MNEETLELLSTFFDDKEMELVKKKEQFRNKEGGGYNVCTAFREIMEKGRNQGIEIGKNQGMKLGEEKGEERVNRLIQRLIQDCRMDEIERAVSDRAYQKELFQKYGI